VAQHGVHLYDTDPCGPGMTKRYGKTASADSDAKDLTIVTVAIPSLTDQFHTVADIGWYTAT
jgi:hypothetical protein